MSYIIQIQGHGPEASGTAQYIRVDSKPVPTVTERGQLRQVAYKLCNFLEHCMLDEELTTDEQDLGTQAGSKP